MGNIATLTPQELQTLITTGVVRTLPQPAPRRRCVEFRDGSACYWALIGDAPAPTTWAEADEIAGSVCLDNRCPSTWEIVAVVKRPAGGVL
jgi:hypothetical protein